MGSRQMTPKMASPFGSSKSLIILSQLLLGRSDTTFSGALAPDLEIAQISEEEFDDLLALANSNHVVMRGLEVFLRITEDAGDRRRAEWAETAIGTERARIENAISFLHKICCTFELEGHDIAVIKSLDHWPDLGSDLDLYTDTNPSDVLSLMKRCFEARLAPRSWGDRLANKWNFVIPGLPEAVEIHMGRLGQTGEQIVIASSLARRARSVHIGNHIFRVPAVSDRLMISTLQRMYRHFYFRLCDIVDSAEACRDRRHRLRGFAHFGKSRRHLGGRGHVPRDCVGLRATLSRRSSRSPGIRARISTIRWRQTPLSSRFLARPDHAGIRHALRVTTRNFPAESRIKEHCPAQFIAMSGNSGSRGAEDHWKR